MNLAVPEASRQKPAAFEFAAFVSNAENQLAFAKQVPVLPSARASYADPFLSTTPASDGGRLSLQTTAGWQCTVSTGMPSLSRALNAP